MQSVIWINPEHPRTKLLLWIWGIAVATMSCYLPWEYPDSSTHYWFIADAPASAHLDLTFLICDFSAVTVILFSLEMLGQLVGAVLARLRAVAPKR